MLTATNSFIYIFIFIGLISFSLMYIVTMREFNDKFLRIIRTDFLFSIKSFKISFKKSMLLLISYYVGIITLTFAIYLLYPDKFDISKPQTFFPAVDSAVGLCIISRLITWEQGYKYGEQFLSALVSSALVIIFINIFIYSSSLPVTINDNASIMQITLQTITNTYNIYLDYAIKCMKIVANYIGFILLSSFFGTYICEKMISTLVPRKRSITDDFENFGKFFVPFTTEDAEEKVKELISRPNLKSIKIISNNLKMFEHNLSSFNNVNFKVIAPAPWNHSRLVHVKLTLLSQTLNQNILKQLVADYEKVYQNRFDYLIELYSQNKLKWRDANYEELNVLIVNDEELLLRVYDIENKKSLYSNDPYAVLQFVHFFDEYFNSI